MRLPFAILVLTGLVTCVLAAEPDSRRAIDAGLKSLTDDAVNWKVDRKCSSCHHIPMTLWVLNEAKQLGHTVNEKARVDLTGWVIAKDDPAKVNPKQPERKQIHVNQTPLMLALAFEAGDATEPATGEGLKAMLKLLIGDQDKDGAWRLMYVWEPHGSTPDVMTTLSLLAISAPNAPDLGAEGTAAREKGLKWLATATPVDTPQSQGLRLVLLKRLGRPSTEWEPLQKKLLARQNADGGWGQAAEMKSDAFATGQALYALAEAGCKSSDPEVAKAHAFLTKSQLPDGSWSMASRPGGPGGKIAKNTEPIAHIGTAWAVLGLLRTTPAVVKGERLPPRSAK